MEHNRDGAQHAMASCRFTLSPGDTPEVTEMPTRGGKLGKQGYYQWTENPCKFGNGMK